MNEVKLSEKGLEAFHSAVVESRKVVDVMGAVRQAFGRMADSVAEYSALLEMDKVRELDGQIRQCTGQVEDVSRQMRSAIDAMQEVAASTRQSFDIEELCRKSAGEWDELHEKISAACSALGEAGAAADALNGKAADSLAMVEEAKAELDRLAGSMLKMQDDVQNEMQALKQEVAESKQDAQEMKRLYADMIEELKASRELFAEIGRQKEALADRKESEAAAMELLLQKYQAVLAEQEKADAAVRERRESGGKALQELMELNELLVQEQKEISSHMQGLLAEAKGVQQETQALMSLGETLRTPDETVMVRACERLIAWLEKNPAQRRSLFQRLKDRF